MSNWGIAACYCGEPLVSTMAFHKKEFVCVKDGRKYGFLDPVKPGLPETPENLARLDANEAEWKALSDGLIGSGAMYESCETCMSTHAPHYTHATAEELAAHEAALERLDTRWKVPA